MAQIVAIAVISFSIVIVMIGVGSWCFFWDWEPGSIKKWFQKRKRKQFSASEPVQEKKKGSSQGFFFDAGMVFDGYKGTADDDCLKEAEALNKFIRNYRGYDKTYVIFQSFSEFAKNYKIIVSELNRCFQDSEITLQHFIEPFEEMWRIVVNNTVKAANVAQVDFSIDLRKAEEENVACVSAAQKFLARMIELNLGRDSKADPAIIKSVEELVKQLEFYKS